MVDVSGIISRIVITIYAILGFDEEHCGGQWTEPDFSGLRRVLSAELYGQHIASEAVPFMLEQQHRRSQHIPSSLLLSFHGTTGVGKTLVSRLITEYLYKRGTKSKFVKTFSYHLTEDPRFYMFEIRREIQETVKMCSRSLFIFDESDKMPAELLHNVQQYLKDTTRSISIFLSNAGGERIMDVTLQHRRNGRTRNSLTAEDMLGHAGLTVFNNADVAVVPFLPLEREHVKMCIRFNARNKRRRPSDELVDTIANEFEYLPTDAQVYSSSGCKRVDEKVNLYTIQTF